MYKFLKMKRDLANEMNAKYDAMFPPHMFSGEPTPSAADIWDDIAAPAHPEASKGEKWHHALRSKLFSKGVSPTSGLNSADDFF